MRIYNFSLPRIAPKEASECRLVAGSRECVSVLTEYSENSSFTRNFDLGSSSDWQLEVGYRERGALSTAKGLQAWQELDEGRGVEPKMRETTSDVDCLCQRRDRAIPRAQIEIHILEFGRNA
jgi:hypothetical protein